MVQGVPCFVCDEVVEQVARAESAGTAQARLDAVAALNAEQLRTYSYPILDQAADPVILGAGFPASPGVATGTAALSSDDAIDRAARGETVILIRPETTPDDMPGMRQAAGILTSRGGRSSHAAIVARGWGTPAVVGADLVFDQAGVRVGDRLLRPGDPLTLDGTSGSVFAGRHRVVSHATPQALQTLLSWADTICASTQRPVTVAANIDQAQDAHRARSAGAVGVGLCRTEHLLLTPGRLRLLRRFLTADGAEATAAALDALEEVQRRDFVEILEAMSPLPVTFRLLDPPLHEFLPSVEGLVGELGPPSQFTDQDRRQYLLARRLHETNPMIGKRGIRHAVLQPGLYRMQVRALARALAELSERGIESRPRILVPMVMDARELAFARRLISEVLTTAGWQLGLGDDLTDSIEVGAMIETPRAALTAAELAPHADFFSFGTNDLTQTTFGFSRADAEAALVPAYEQADLLEHNPFLRLDGGGVGRLIEAACRQAQQFESTIQLGACGIHASDPNSIEQLVGYGVASLSVPPRDVAVARLAAAQAVLVHDLHDHAALERTFHPPVGEHPPVPDGAASNPADVATGDLIDESVVLHVLRLRGYLSASELTASIGVLPQDLLHRLQSEGAVRFVETRKLFALLPPGRARHQAHLDGGDLAGPGLSELLAPTGSTRRRLSDLGEAIRSISTDWHFRNGTTNDHHDAGYDRSVLDRAQQVCRSAGALLDELGSTTPRLTRYRVRLHDAVDGARAGDYQRIAGRGCESMEEIWLELIDDLELTAGTH